MKGAEKKQSEAIRVDTALKMFQETKADVLPADWRSRPLSEIVEVLSEHAGARTYETLSISAGIGFVNQAKKFGKELSGKQYEKYIVLHRGDFSYNKGNSNRFPQGCIYRLEDREEAAVPNVFESFRIADGNADFYNQLFLSGFLNRQLCSKINHGVRDDGLLNLTGKDFYSCEVPFPPIQEQTRIAEILVQCDKVISLQQEKIEKLKKLKRFFLQKMFPQSGCNVPEIRFPGFTDAWEQRKFADLFDTVANNTLSRAELTADTGAGRDVHYGDILVKLGECLRDVSELPFIADDQTVQKFISARLQNGDVIIADTAEDETVGKCTEILNVQGEIVISGLHTIPCRPREKFAPAYLGYFMNSPAYHDQLRPLMQGIKVTSVSKSALQDTVLSMPKSQTEQGQIGQFFLNLDHLIALHQRELEELQRGKKALAQLLLTGRVRVKTEAMGH